MGRSKIQVQDQPLCPSPAFPKKQTSARNQPASVALRRCRRINSNYVNYVEVSEEEVDFAAAEAVEKISVAEDEKDEDSSSDIQFIEEDSEDVEERTNQSRKRRTRKQCSPIGNKSVADASKAMKSYKSFESPYPYFDIVMEQNHVTGTQLSIPIKEARKYFHMKEKQIMSVEGVDGRTWPMGYYVGDPYRVKISCGWKKFAAYYNLQVDDICVFEVVDLNSMDLKVTIFKNRPERATPPSFVIHMCPSSLIGRENVNIPKDHFERYLKEDRERDTLVLHGACGKSWPVKCHFSTENATTSRAAFVNGWRAFTADNNLKVGDTCKFEMMMGKANEYKVTVSRKADQAGSSEA